MKIYVVHSWREGDDGSEYAEEFIVFRLKSSAHSYIKANFKCDWYDDGCGGKARDVYSISLQEVINES